MGKVISSNLNSLLDKAEDSSKTVNFTIDEMGESLREAKKEIVEALGTQKVLAKKMEELDTDVAKWERRAELALKSGDESLAREALKQKKRIVGERDRAEARRSEQRGIVLNMKREMERMKIKHEELKGRRGALAGEMERAKRGMDDPLSAGGGEAFAKFRDMENKIEGVRAEAEAYSEIDAALNDGLSEAELDQKFAALEGKGYSGDGSGGGLDDEIERLKKKLRIDS